MNDIGNINTPYLVNESQDPSQKNRSNGTLKKLALVVLVLVALGAIAYAVYLWTQNVNLKNQVSQKENQVAALSSMNSSLQKSNESNANPAVTENSADYLYIKEWGIKMKLSAGIKDAYYQIISPTMISLKTHSLDVEESCRKADLSFYSLTKTGKDTIDPDSATKAKYADEFKDNGTLIGDNFYYSMHAQYNCVEDNANAATRDKAAQGFTASAKALEKI